MTIFLSNAPNEDDLEPLFGGLARRWAIPYGDFNFQGQWVDGEEVWVWGERKRLRDLVQCVMSSGRFLRQIQEAHTAGFRFFFSVIEGIFRANPQTGLLEHRRGGGWETFHVDPRNPDSPTIAYSRIDNYLNQIDYYLGVRVRMSSGPSETVRKVTDLYHLFQKPPEDHSSLKQFETHRDAGASYLSKPSLVRRVAKEFPGVGWDRSRGFDEVFPTLRDLSQAIVEGDEKWLTAVEGVGRKTARAILDASKER